MAEQATVEPEVNSTTSTETTTEVKATSEADAGKTTEAKAEGTTDGKASDKGESLLGAKPKEVTVEAVVPEKYEFTMPEGRELDNGLVEKFTPILKELKVTQEGAQKLASLLVEDQMAKEAQYQKITEGWKQETIKALGADHPAQLSVAAKFIDKFGNDKVRQVLNDTGLGNHPEIVQMFIKAGKHFGNDPFVTGTTKQNTLSDPEKAARKLFNNTKYE